MPVKQVESAQAWNSRLAHCRFIKLCGVSGDRKEKVNVQVRILIDLLVFNPFSYFVIF